MDSRGSFDNIILLTRIKDYCTHEAGFNTEFFVGGGGGVMH